MDISVIIPVRNGNKTLPRCLESLDRSELPPSEVILVDDCSQRDCTPMADKHGFRAIRLDRPCGGWYARNRGAQLARGDILVFIDGDMVVPPDALSRIKFHFSNHHYAAISGICGAKTNSRRLVTLYKNLWMYHSYIKSPEDFDWFISGISAVRRDIFFELGGFDSRFNTRTGGGDLEFGRRLKEKGKNIFLDKGLQAEHLKPYSFWGLLRNDFCRSKGWFQLIVKKRMIPQVVRKLRVANIYPGFMISVFISLVFLASLIFSVFHVVFGFIATASAAAYLITNLSLFRFFQREKGWGFLLKAIPLSLADHAMSGLGVIAGCLGSLPTLLTKRIDITRLEEVGEKMTPGSGKQNDN